MVILSHVELLKQLCVNPGSRWGGTLHSRRESDAGRRGPQALDWAAGEHRHLLGAEAVRQRDCAAAAAQVQALQVTTLWAVNSTAQHGSVKGRCDVTGVKKKKKKVASVSFSLSQLVHPHPPSNARLKVENLWISLLEFIILTVNLKKTFWIFDSVVAQWFRTVCYLEERRLQVEVPLRAFLYGICILRGFSPPTVQRHAH